MVIQDIETKMVHVRLPLALVKRVDHLGVEWQSDRARTMERLLNDAVTRFEQPGPG